MPDIPPKKATTWFERSQYWRQVRGEAWELSREQFQRHHEVLVAAIALALVWYVRGRKEMVNELFTSLFYVAIPVGLYLVVLSVVNFFRAMVRVPVYYQRDIARLTDEIAGMKARRLQLEFLDDLIDYSNQNVFDVVVSVHNPTESTVSDVSVCIESIQKMDEPDQSDTTRLLPMFRNLSLPLRDDHTTPPRREIDIHPNMPPVIFKLVTLQRYLPQQRQHGEILLHHTEWQVEKDAPSFNSPYQRPGGALPLGRYRVRLRAQGRDVPTALLTIEFENVADRAKAWQVS